MRAWGLGLRLQLSWISYQPNKTCKASKAQIGLTPSPKPQALLLRENAQPNLSKLPFGVERELPLHHPIIKRRFFFENSHHGLAFVLTEVDDDFSLCVADHSASQVDEF